MLMYIVKRLLLMVPTLIGMTLVLFLLVRFAPGLVTGGGEFGGGGAMRSAQAREVAKKKLEQRLHLVDAQGHAIPVALQYVYWLNDTLHGDFGDSVEFNSKVSDVDLAASSRNFGHERHRHDSYLSVSPSPAACWHPCGAARVLTWAGAF